MPPFIPVMMFGILFGLSMAEVFLKLLGLGMATAIVADATIVRMVLAPSVMQLLGDANWWISGWLERILPRLDVTAAAPRTGVRRAA